MARLSPADLDEVIGELLQRRPPARVVAIGDNGLFVPLPPSVPLEGHRVIERATSGLDLVIPEDIGVVIETWEEARATGAAQGVVHPAVAPEITVEMHFVDARHVHGVYLGFVLGSQVAGVLDSAPEKMLRPRYGVTHKNDLAVLTFCDESILQILGWSAAELIGRRSLEIVHPDDHARAVANWLDLLAHPGASRRVRLRHRRVDGGYVWLEITNTNYLNDPERGHVLGEVVDISEEMAATEALRAGEALMRRITEALPVGVVQLDADGVIVYRNERVEAVIGRSLPVGASWEDVLTADGPACQQVGAPLEAALRTGVDGDVEVPLPLPDGCTRRIQVSLRPLVGLDGVVTGAIACLHDVTEAVQLRETLAHQATYDALTGCLRRRALLERLNGLLASGATVTALFIDLDGFKPVNDRHGHAVGDALLRHVGECLRKHVGESGLVGRLGGDEFLVTTIGPCDDAEAAAAADAVAQAIGAPLLIDGVRLSARASVGVARSAPGDDADTLVAAADAVMYRTKTERRRTARP